MSCRKKLGNLGWKPGFLTSVAHLENSILNASGFLIYQIRGWTMVNSQYFNPIILLRTRWFYNLTPSLNSCKCNLFFTSNCLILLATLNVFIYRRRNKKFDLISLSRHHFLSMINSVSWWSIGERQVRLQWDPSLEIVILSKSKWSVFGDIYWASFLCTYV